MSRRSRAELAGVILGDASPVAVMGVINVSPESFHAGSVYHGEEAVLRAALGMVEAGAALIDLGIGFFRDAGVVWHAWDVAVLAGLPALAALGRPLCVGVSRKSFVGAITGRDDPAARLLDTLGSFWVVVLVVLFQPELRRALTSIGHAAVLRTLFGGGGVETVRVVDEIASVAGSLAERRIGALIVIERGTGLRQYAELGVALDALVSADLLTSLFLPYSPLHDG